MLNNSFYLEWLFILTTVLTVWFFFKASKNSGLFLLVMLFWLAVQAGLAYSGFYKTTDSIPPRFILMVMPPMLGIVCLFLFPAGRRFLDGLDLKTLTWLHVVRIPVEITLLLLYKQHLVPKLMTFEGANPDILSGITAIVVALFLFQKGKVKKNSLLAWNFLCLILLANIVFRAVLSAPSVFQKFAFDMPNRAVLGFPYVWLPCAIVPIVLLSHLASIRKLLRMKA